MICYAPDQSTYPGFNMICYAPDQSTYPGFNMLAEHGLQCT